MPDSTRPRETRQPCEACLGTGGFERGETAFDCCDTCKGSGQVLRRWCTATSLLGECGLRLFLVAYRSDEPDRATWGCANGHRWQGVRNGHGYDWTRAEDHVEIEAGLVSDTKHTPGPWTPKAIAMVKGAPEDGPWYVFEVSDTEGNIIAAVYPEDSPEGDANARLIAASPDMLAALIAAESALAVQASYRDAHQARSQKALDATRAAIALAREAVAS